MFFYDLQNMQVELNRKKIPQGRPFVSESGWACFILLWESGFNMSDNISFEHERLSASCF